MKSGYPAPDGRVDVEIRNRAESCLSRYDEPKPLPFRRWNLSASQADQLTDFFVNFKTHKREMSLWFAGFRNLLPGALPPNLRVPSGTYTFMSLDPSTTLADLFRPPLVADPFSTVRASLRR
jgi:hypothetical protein